MGPAVNSFLAIKMRLPGLMQASLEYAIVFYSHRHRETQRLGILEPRHAIKEMSSPCVGELVLLSGTWAMPG